MKPAKLPGIWLMTDERLGGLSPADPLWRAIRKLPRGAGIVFRHYSLDAQSRRALLAKIAPVARRRGLLLIGSGIEAPDGRHFPASAPLRGHPRIATAAAHSRRELLQAFHSGADLVFLSPVFTTRSHPGARGLGPIRFGLAARNAPGPVVPLGGMDAARARRLAPLGGTGFAAIDYWGRV